MGRSPYSSKDGYHKGAWTAHEDKLLRDYVRIHGEGKWNNAAKEAGLKRCGKSCRLRWMNYLRPDIKRGNITEDEEELIIRLHKLLGNRWALIAGRLPGRTDNEIKNYWNSNLAKKAQELESSQFKNSHKVSIEEDPFEADPDSARANGAVAMANHGHQSSDHNNDNKSNCSPSFSPKMEFMGSADICSILGLEFTKLQDGDIDIMGQANKEEDAGELEAVFDQGDQCGPPGVMMTSDLQSLASFLDSNDSWLEEDLTKFLSD